MLVPNNADEGVKCPGLGASIVAWRNTRKIGLGKGKGKKPIAKSPSQRPMNGGRHVDARVFLVADWASLARWIRVPLLSLYCPIIHGRSSRPPSPATRHSGPDERKRDLSGPGQPYCISVFLAACWTLVSYSGSLLCTAVLPAGLGPESECWENREGVVVSDLGCSSGGRVNRYFLHQIFPVPGRETLLRGRQAVITAPKGRPPRAANGEDMVPLRSRKHYRTSPPAITQLDSARERALTLALRSRHPIRRCGRMRQRPQAALSGPSCRGGVCLSTKTAGADE